VSDEPIPPALTPAEWADIGRPYPYPKPWYESKRDALVLGRIRMIERMLDEERWAAVAALANAARDDADPGKITRAMVDALRDCVRWSENPERGYGRTPETEMAARLADALESLFPPEGTDAV
jgi:hypothetical protein